MTHEQSLILTPAESDAEFQYRIAERLALLTNGQSEPSKWQFWLAREEAFKWLEESEN